MFCLFAGWISAQTISIKGHVEDSKHHSLPGATVYLWIKDSPSTRVGNVTGNDGCDSIGATIDYVWLVCRDYAKEGRLD